jgi:hypothetical protein
MFEIVPTDNDALRLKWHGECQLTIDELERKQKGSPKLEAAEKFLLDELAGGPQEVNSLLAKARGVCSKRTLDTVKQTMGIKTIRKGKGRNHQVFWSLK